MMEEGLNKWLNPVRVGLEASVRSVWVGLSISDAVKDREDAGVQPSGTRG